MKTLALTLLTVALATPGLADPPQMVEPASLKTNTTLQVTEDISYPDATGTHTFHHRARMQAARENRYRMETLASPGDPYVGSVTVCDGKTVTIYNAKSQTVTYQAFRLHAGYGPDEEITEGYFSFEVKKGKLEGRDTLYARLDGEEPIRASNGEVTGQKDLRMEWWFDPQTKLPLRNITYRTVYGKLREVYRKDYSDWVVDKPIDPATFQFTPPAGAKEITK